MTTDPRPTESRPWWPHAITFALMMLYLPSLALSHAAVADIFDAVWNRKRLFVLALFTLLSYLAVGLGLTALTFAAAFRNQRIPKVIRIVLALYWLPHVALAALWSIPYGTSNWVP